MRRQRRPKVEESEEASAEEEEATEAPSAPVAPRRPVIRRRWLPFEINWTAMLVIVVLIAITVFALLLNQGILPAQIVTWWPLAVAIPAAIWFLVSLLRRDARSLLGSTALFGLSLSMLLSTQIGAPLSTTLVGITFITVGTGIMLRGLLLRNQPIA